MSSEQQRYSRQDLLNALEKGWKQYLPHLAMLTEEEQTHYAQQQGYRRVQDVIAHIFAWWELSMGRTREELAGHEVPLEDDMDEFNAGVVAHYQNWSRSAIEEKFATTLATFERFLHDLPDSALENERIRLWLRLDAIDHYEDHRPPNAPSLREAKEI